MSKAYLSDELSMIQLRDTTSKMQRAKWQMKQQNDTQEREIDMLQLSSTAGLSEVAWLAKACCLRE
jgi:hypothetical protein